MIGHRAIAQSLQDGTASLFFPLSPTELSILQFLLVLFSLMVFQQESTFVGWMNPRPEALSQMIFLSSFLRYSCCLQINHGSTQPLGYLPILQQYLQAFMANIGLSLCFLSGVMVNFGQQQWDF
jgi:hypothetical protein